MDPAPADPLAPGRAALPASSGGNLALAVVAGLAAALAGAVLWALLVSLMSIKIGFAAIGIGFLVGWAVRGAGQGRSPLYGFVAGVLALLGCVAGDISRTAWPSRSTSTGRLSMSSPT